jgi:hypothetical protein
MDKREIKSGFESIIHHVIIDLATYNSSHLSRLSMHRARTKAMDRANDNSFRYGETFQDPSPLLEQVSRACKVIGLEMGHYGIKEVMWIGH